MLEDIPRPALWKRLLLGAFLCIFAAAGATAVAAFREIDKVVDALERGRELKLGADKVAETDPGEPPTLMILGSDRRPRRNIEGAAGARSDTIMLVRLDGDEEATAILSLPRDLRVKIPGHGTDKINAAYEVGGPELTLETVKSVTGLRVNHVINVHFSGFWRAVNAVGCVYADIDRRYFNDSAAYAYIDVQPGYQRMCGRKALQYVRFRHEDTDIVRAARQQDFLRQAKQQIVFTDLIDNRDRLVKIFGRNTSTDSALRSRSEVLRLLKLALGTADQPIREVRFRGSLGPTYVESSPRQMSKMVDEFLNVEDPEETVVAAPKQRQARQAQEAALGGRPRPGGRERLRPGPGAPGGRGGRGHDAAGALPGPAHTGLGLRRTSPRLQDARHGQADLRRLPHGAADREGGRVLRPPGHHLEGPADPRGRHRDAEGGQAHLRAGARRRPRSPGRMAHPQGRLLDLEHPAADAERQADDGHRPIGARPLTRCASGFTSLARRYAG